MLVCIYLLALLTMSAVAEKDEAKTALDIDSERVVRDAVYYEEAATFSKRELPGASMLVVPERLQKVYKEHPEAVVDLLLKIMEGANPRESVLAAGYAMSLLKGPARGAVCVENFEAKKYDSLDKDWRVTPRKHWIGRVLELRKK